MSFNSLFDSVDLDPTNEEVNILVFLRDNIFRLWMKSAYLKEV